jgi:hypothetical protein
MELHKFSSQFLRKELINNEIEMKLKCSQLFIDCQQQCIFLINVNFKIDKNNFEINFLFFIIEYIIYTSYSIRIFNNRTNIITKNNWNN